VPTVRAIHRRAAAILIPAALTLATIMGLLGVLSACAVAAHPTAAAKLTTAAVDPASMTDTQLAAAIAADCTPGACQLTPTAANVDTRWVPWVCAQVAQLDPPPGNAAWQRAWPKIGPLVVATGRCSQPSTSQLARELAALPGASGKVMDPASLDQLLEHACPEIGARTHTTYSAAVLRLVAASGRCSA
jgi:hypothetical protein